MTADGYKSNKKEADHNSDFGQCCRTIIVTSQFTESNLFFFGGKDMKFILLIVVGGCIESFFDHFNINVVRFLPLRGE
jgi:hypothetical protein